MGATKDIMIDEMFPPKTEEEMDKEDDEWNDMMLDEREKRMIDDRLADLCF